jgi:CRP/FNR family transcriptional regulator
MTDLALNVATAAAERTAPGCALCSVGSLCIANGLSIDQRKQLAGVTAPRLKVRKGQALFHAGDDMEHLYAIRRGSFKTTLVSADGRAQITGFWMSGDVMGLEAISGNRHLCTALAIEDSEVCPLVFSDIERLARHIPALQHRLSCMLSQEIAREYRLRLCMGTLSADERLAAFLLELSQRNVARGYSARGFVLRMTREDIACYLGLRLETVCRAIARLRQVGILSCRARVIDLLDLAVLERFVADGCHKAERHACAV